MRSASMLFLALVSAAPSGKAKPKAPRARAGETASIIERTKDTVYFDRGSDSGFGEGAEVEVVRRGRAVGTCRIEHASSHQAECKDGGRFQVNDGARLLEAKRNEADARGSTTDRSPSAGRPGQKSVASPPETLGAVPFVKVTFDRSGVSSQVPLRPAGVEASANVGYQVWTSSPRNSSYQTSNADVLIRRLSIGSGVSANVDASALGWTISPPIERFRPDTAAQFYLFEASAESREVGRAYAASVGRIRPWHAPGLVAIDGGQVGWRSQDGTLEVGALAGALPDLSTLSPSTDRWTLGGYWSASLGTGGPLVVRQDGRVGLVSINGPGEHGEAEATVHALLPSILDVGGGARIGLVGPSMSTAVLDNVRADVTFTPGGGLRLSGGYRERRGALPDLDPAATAAGYAVIASRRADVALAFDAAPWVAISLVGGFFEQIDVDGRMRAFAGPELAFPGAFGSLGSLSFGYLEERGWLAGRSGFVQTAMTPIESLSWLMRMSYFEDVTFQATSRELGFFTRISYALGARLAVSAMLLARGGIFDVDQSLGGGPIGITSRLALSGSL